MAIIHEIGSDDANVRNCTIGLFLAVILEQWPFLMKSASSHTIQHITTWLIRYLGFSMQVGEDSNVLSYFRDQIQQRLSDVEAISLLEKPLEEPEQFPSARISSVLNTADEREVKGLVTVISQSETSGAQIEPNVTEASSQTSLPGEVDDERCLTRWTKKDIGQALLDGDVGALILCLCSKYEEIRKQALNNLRVVLGKLKVGSSLFKLEQD